MEESLKTNVAGCHVDRFVRCRKTRNYFAGRRGEWTADPREAQTFSSDFEVARGVVDNQLQDVDMVLRVQGAEYDLFSTQIR